MLLKITVLTLLIILSGCGKQPESNNAADVNDVVDLAGEYDDSVVLTVGDRNFTGSVLAPILERLNGDSLMVNMKLEALINRMLILQNAHDRGYDSTREMALYFYEREREKLQNDWLVWILDQKVELPPDTVEEYYSQMGTMLVYRAITVKDRAHCDSLRQLVINGENMGDLAEEYSINTREAINRGVLGPVDMMEAFPGDYMLLRGLETGELSSLDSSYSGWRFLRIDSTYQDTIPPFAEIKDIIASRILGRLKMAYKDELFDSLRTVNNLQITEGIPELIASHFLENSQDYEPFTSEQENMVAYSFTGGRRTIYSLAENIRNLPPIGYNDPDDPDWIREYSWLLGLYDIMSMEAKQLGMDTLPDNVSYMDQRFSNQVLDVYYAEVIEPRLIPTEEKLLEIYEAEKDSLIIQEERVFKTISAVGEGQLDLFNRVMESGGDPFSMIEELTAVQSILAPGESIITRPMTVSDIPPPWNEMLFNAEMHESVTCSVSAEQLLLFELTEIRPEHIATFDESQDQLLAIFRSMEEEEVISGLVDSLRSVYHIEINRGFVDKFIYSDSLSIDQP
ncbi:MAG: hypothetical protein KAT09_01405 [Candidatus Aegiribacteria sp.]|nr:hypothetical protein [Candidatus Aegiribacteria sp.]